MNYSEKLLNPLWQRKRLEILSRDEYTCQLCHNKEQTLHIHHRHYLIGREPWDYPGELLITLCKTCHKKEEDAALSANEVLNTLHYWGYFNTEILQVLNNMINLKIQERKTYADQNGKGLDTVGKNG